MKGYRINVNYAKALFLLAQELDKTDAVMEDMRLVHQVCNENRLLNVVLDNPTIREAKKVTIMQDLFRSYVTDVTVAFLTFVTKKRRTINLKGISEAFMDMFRDSRNIVLAEMVTAEEVPQALVDELRSKVADHTHKNVEVYNHVDPRMMGGFCMTYDNNMYDARLRTKVTKLRKEFSRNIYEKKL